MSNNLVPNQGMSDDTTDKLKAACPLNFFQRMGHNEPYIPKLENGPSQKVRYKGPPWFGGLD